MKMMYLIQGQDVFHEYGSNINKIWFAYNITFQNSNKRKKPFYEMKDANAAMIVIFLVVSWLLSHLSLFHKLNYYCWTPITKAFLVS